MFLGLFTAGHRLSDGLRLGLAALGLLTLAGSMFMAVGTLLRRPRKDPRLRVGGALILALGGVAILMMTPFGAMALAVFFAW